MKVVLVQPPIQDFYDTDVRLQPIGLCYLKAAVTQHLPDVTVIIKDFHHGGGRRTVALPRELAYLTEYYAVADKAPFSTFHQYYHFGRSFDAIEAELAELQPDVVGISSLFTPYYREALEVAVRVKNRSAVPVVMGGSQCFGGAGIGLVACVRRLCHSRRGRAAVRGAAALLAETAGPRRCA